MDPPSLLDLLGDVSTESFFRDHWETRVLHVKRDAPNFYDALVTFKEVDEYLGRTDLRYPYVRLVKSGSELPLNEYANDMTFGDNLFQGNLDNDKIFSLYNSGATLCMQLQHLAFPGLRDFGNRNEEEFGFKTQSTMFLTPSSSQGFTAHFDTHDFFVFQIHGEKEWLIYDEKCELPLGSSRVFDDEVDLTDSIPRKFMLRPGDMLYVPRGVYHEAKTATGTSLQVSFGVFPVMWVDLLHKIVDRAALTNRSLRSVANSPFSDCNLAEVALQEFTLALAAEPPAQILSEMKQDVLRQQGKSCRGRLLDTERISDLDASTPLSMRAINCRLKNNSGDKAVLSFYDKELELPTAVISELAFIVEQKGLFTINSIPSSLTLEEIKPLVELLIIEGLLSIKDPIGKEVSSRIHQISPCSDRPK